MLALLDLQHVGKPNHPNDLGASFDLNGNGVIEVHEYEASLTPAYIAEATRELTRRGHLTTLFSRGYYSERHSEANALSRDLEAIGPAAYVACHLNAGGGKYGAIFYDHRSKNGKALAEQLAEALEKACPELSSARAIPAQPGDCTANAYYTIKGIYSGPRHLSGVCYEPAFLDYHLQLVTPEGLKRLGQALATGLNAWGNAAA